MQRYVDEFQNYSDSGGNSGFCEICEGPEFILIAFICLLAIIALFFVGRIKKKVLRLMVYAFCIALILTLLNVTKYPGPDILLSAFVICMIGFFGYIGIGYILLGVYNFIRDIVDMLRNN